MDKGIIVQEKNDIKIIWEAVWLRHALQDFSYEIDVIEHFIDKPNNKYKILSDISIELVDENEIDNSIEAVSFPDKNLIKFRTSYYNAIVDYLDKKVITGLAYRAKFTLMHEIYHVLSHKNVGMQRADIYTPLSKCSEIQANKFAGAFLLPPFLYPTLKNYNIYEIRDICGVSKGCISYQMNLYKQLERKLGGIDAVANLKW